MLFNITSLFGVAFIIIKSTTARARKMPMKYQSIWPVTSTSLMTTRRICGHLCWASYYCHHVHGAYHTYQINSQNQGYTSPHRLRRNILPIKAQHCTPSAENAHFVAIDERRLTMRHTAFSTPALMKFERYFACHNIYSDALFSIIIRLEPKLIRRYRHDILYLAKLSTAVLIGYITFWYFQAAKWRQN